MITMPITICSFIIDNPHSLSFFKILYSMPSDAMIEHLIVLWIFSKVNASEQVFCLAGCSDVNIRLNGKRETDQFHLSHGFS